MITIKRLLLAAFFALLACAWAAPAAAACAGGVCFVVAGGGSSNNNATWSTTSGGTTCTCQPGTTDAVILDSLAGQLTLAASLTVGTFDASGTGGSGSPYTGILTHNSSVTLTIATAATNSLKFSTQMTYTPATAGSLITFTSTSGTAVVTSSGKNFAAITMNGAGGTVQQADDITITAKSGSLLTLTAGTWDANTHAITVSAVNGNNANQHLTLGGLVKIGGANVSVGNASFWNFASASAGNFTKNAANIEVVVGNTIALTFGGGALTYNGITFDANTGAGQGINISGANTFSSFAVGSGWSINGPNGVTITVGAGGFAITGTQANPSFYGAAAGGSTTVSSGAGACASTWAVLLNVTATGGCTFTATNSINLGVNTGWSISPPTFGTGGGESDVPGTVM